MLESKGANIILFFKQITNTKNSMWLHILKKRGYFTDQPTMQDAKDGLIDTLSWLPISYLLSIASSSTDEVIDVVEQLPAVDNRMICSALVDMALQINDCRSVKLLPKILEYVKANSNLFGDYTGLLAHWVAMGKPSAAMRLFKELTKITKKPKKNQQQRTEGGKLIRGYDNLLLHLDNVQGHYLVAEGARLLARVSPFDVTRIIARVIHKMIDTHMSNEKIDYSDSELWCKNLRQDEEKSHSFKETLVHTLTYACEQVYEKQKDKIVELDKYLCRQEWRLFLRIRRHLYKEFPSEKNKSSIQKMILEHKEYYGKIAA